MCDFLPFTRGDSFQIPRGQVSWSVHFLKLHAPLANPLLSSAPHSTKAVPNQASRFMKRKAKTKTKRKKDLLNTDRKVQCSGWISLLGLCITSLQKFGFSEHYRNLPKALTRVNTEMNPQSENCQSQCLDFPHFV